MGGGLDDCRHLTPVGRCARYPSLGPCRMCIDDSVPLRHLLHQGKYVLEDGREARRRALVREPPTDYLQLGGGELVRGRSARTGHSREGRMPVLRHSPQTPPMTRLVECAAGCSFSEY